MGSHILLTGQRERERKRERKKRGREREKRGREREKRERERLSIIVFLIFKRNGGYPGNF
jgi:hypothetical protein